MVMMVASQQQNYQTKPSLICPAKQSQPARDPLAYYYTGFAYNLTWTDGEQNTRGCREFVSVRYYTLWLSHRRVSFGHRGHKT